MLEPVPPDAQDKPGRQRIDDRDADAVQAAGNLVGILVEFSAGVQLGHDDLGRRHAFLVVDPGRNPAPVVGDRDRAVGVEGDGDELRVTGQRLVDGVVDHLVDHVVEARTVVGVADVHARPLAHGVQAAQHLDRIRAVAFAGGLGLAGQVLAFFFQNQSLTGDWSLSDGGASIRARPTLACHARRCTLQPSPGRRPGAPAGHVHVFTIWAANRPFSSAGGDFPARMSAWSLATFIGKSLRAELRLHYGELI